MESRVPALTVSEVLHLLDAELLCGEQHLDAAVLDYAASDLLSEVLALEKDRYLLLTGLTSLQVVRTAEITGAVAVAFVHNRPPSQEAIGLAKSHRIPLMMTPHSLFEAVRRIVEELERKKAQAE